MEAPRRVLRPLDRGRAIARDGGATSQDRFVGSSLRDLRRAREITLARLSELTGLSVGFLSQVERGISSPSVKALHDISRALGVTISWFFLTHEDVKPQERNYIVRASRRRHLSFESGIVDFLILRKQRINIRALYDDSPDSDYAYWGGFNLAAIAGMVAGFFTYIYLLNPITYESNSPYEFISAALPSAVVGAVVYLIVTLIVVQPAGKGGYK